MILNYMCTYLDGTMNYLKIIKDSYFTFRWFFFYHMAYYLNVIYCFQTFSCLSALWL